VEKDNLNLSNILNRATDPTPPFWKKVRRLGLMVAGVGTALLTIPTTAGIALPAVVSTFAGYAVVAGTVTTALSQLASENK
jgi:hypothetical protein